MIMTTLVSSGGAGVGSGGGGVAAGAPQLEASIDSKAKVATITRTDFLIFVLLFLSRQLYYSGCHHKGFSY